MTSVRLMDRPVHLRQGDEDAVDSDLYDEEASNDEQLQDDESGGDTSQSDHEETSSLSDAEPGHLSGDISFGALAKAQESFGPRPHKRKIDEAFEESILQKSKRDEPDFFDTRRRAKEPRVDAPKRTSKHAPAVESARKPVSRKRVIFEPIAALKSRDPRFDPTVMSTGRDANTSDKANKNYSFLSTYQAAEILDLKSQIKKATDPATAAELKRKVMSLESKLRGAEARQRETDIRKKHKEKEKEALRTGQKSRPYYLKEADVKKMAKEERLQGLGKRARDKAEKRQKKREKTKEARDMPRVRRER